VAVALLVGHPELCSLVVLALAMLLPFVAAMAGARFTLWSGPQRRLWQAFHLLDAKGREVVTDEAYAGRATGRLDGVPVSVTISSAFVVTWQNGASCKRSVGQHVTIVAEAAEACSAPFEVRAEAPIDEEDDSWKVSDRRCEALGAPFRGERDREPRDEAARRLRGDASEALRRLVTFDEATTTGWLRLALSCADGKVRLEAVVFGEAKLDDALAVVAALARTSSTDADVPARSAGSYRELARPEGAAPETGVTPPLPPFPPPRLRERAWIALLTQSLEGSILAPLAVTWLLAFSVPPYAAHALASAGIILDDWVLPGDAESDPMRFVAVDVEGRRVKYQLDVQRPEAHGCAVGTRVVKAAWSSDFVCDGGTVRIQSFERPYAPAIAGGVALLFVVVRCRRKYLEARHDDSSPPRLSRVE